MKESLINFLFIIDEQENFSVVQTMQLFVQFNIHLDSQRWVSIRIRDFVQQGQSDAAQLGSPGFPFLLVFLAVPGLQWLRAS
jgi:hypothetical protein